MSNKSASIMEQAKKDMKEFFTQKYSYLSNQEMVDINITSERYSFEEWYEALHAYTENQGGDWEGCFVDQESGWKEAYDKGVSVHLAFKEKFIDKKVQDTRFLCTAPDYCPITGLPFFMIIEDRIGEMVPTYGGPYDSYTIPVLEYDGEDKGTLTRKRFDHDLGDWREEIEELDIVALSREHYEKMKEKVIIYDSFKQIIDNESKY